jgi:hypothetical protein
LSKNPFDQVARAIQIRAEADRVFAIAYRRNVRPCALLTGELPDPVRVVSASSIVRGSKALRRTEHSRLSCTIVKHFTRRERARWTGEPFNDRINLAGEATA